MFIRCNPNPLGKQLGDCVVRAISIATSQGWRQTYDELCEEGRRQADMPASNAVWGAVLKRKGFRQFMLPEACPECVTVRAFSRMYPEGVYVIGTGTHAVTVIDGDWYDSWDSGDVVPAYFWREEE